jgi:hypothetical protein
MEHIDLNISNYSLNDILNLFKIDMSFGEEDMRVAKKTVLMTHPDKSGLDPKYFLFFTSAYRLLYNVFKVRERGEQDTCVKRVYTSTEIDEDQDNSEAWKKLSSRKDFNKIFNEMFEKHVVIQDKDDGHGDWLKEEDDVMHAKNKNEMDEMIREKKASLRSLIVYDGIKEMGGDSGTTLTGVGGSNHSSLFSSLQYDDVKTAYTESVVPVTEEDYHSRKKHSSMDAYRREREMEINSYNMDDHNAKYRKQKQSEMQSDAYRAFSLAKQDEHYREINKAAASSLLKLTNSNR